ncbi:MAG: CDGSH iron-sulfur domain-containing protein [Anaerolineae bacterium]|nr:CDGSH iron-sulfur domain-containing protein [Anaerolineae bacterium]
MRITALENGPLKFQGRFEIVDEADAVLFKGDTIRLCRCGGSGRKPFCDGTHQRNAFQADEASSHDDRPESTGCPQ